MKNLVIRPSKLKGSINIPPSKSHSIRAILFAMMGQGTSLIESPLSSPDVTALLDALKLFHIPIKILQDKIEIEGCAGKLSFAEDIIQVGNSGQILRFLGAMSALIPSYTIFTGDASIRHLRLTSPLIKGLRDLGAFADTVHPSLQAPLIVKGPLRPGFAHIAGEDSQPVSALLMAASFLPGITEIKVDNPGETPWVNLTLDWLKRLNIRVDHDHFTHYEIKGSASYSGFNYKVPGDFSSAAFPLVAALITGSEIRLNNMDIEDVQGDKQIIPLLQAMGAKITTNKQEKNIHIRSSSLTSIDIDVNPIIDAVPILSVLGCFGNAQTRLFNAKMARNKESDRLAAMVKELKKMGAKLQETEDGLVLFPSRLKGGIVDSHQDHRIALALCVAALGAEGETIVRNVDCIEKSFPYFTMSLKVMGAHIEETT